MECIECVKNKKTWVEDVGAVVKRVLVPNRDIKADVPEDFDRTRIRGAVWLEADAKGPPLFVLGCEIDPVTLRPAGDDVAEWVAREDVLALHRPAPSTASPALRPPVPVCQGFEECVLTMRPGEVCECNVRADFGFTALDDVPERARNARLLMRLQCVDFDRDKQPWDTQDADELVDMGEARKAAGNACVKRGDPVRALQSYKRASHCTGAVLLSWEKEKTKEGDECDRDLGIRASDAKKNNARRLDCSIKANMAACHLKLQKWKAARELCEEVLEYECDNAKVRFRLGCALARIYDSANGLDLAVFEFKRCLEIDPDNKEAARHLALVEKRIRSQNKTERKKANLMFAPVRT